MVRRKNFRGRGQLIARQVLPPGRLSPARTLYLTPPDPALTARDPELTTYARYPKSFPTLAVFDRAGDATISTILCERLRLLGRGEETPRSGSPAAWHRVRF